MKNFPVWFWISILTFIFLSWISIPIADFLSNDAVYVVQTIAFFGLIVYPIYYIVMIILLFKKVILDSDEKIWALLILLIPIFVYFPFWSIISLN